MLVDLQPIFLYYFFQEGYHHQVTLHTILYLNYDNNVVRNEVRYVQNEMIRVQDDVIYK